MYPTTSCYPHEPWFQRALTLLWALSRVEVASWHYHPRMKIWKVCNEKLVEDANHLLLTCQAYKVSEKHDKLFDGHDNLSLSSNPDHKGWAHMAKYYFHTANVYSREVTPHLRKDPCRRSYVYLGPYVKISLFIDNERSILFFQVHHYTQVVQKQTFQDPPYCQIANTDHDQYRICKINEA